MIFDGCLTESKKNVMYEFSKAKDVLKNAIAHHLVEFIVPRKDKSGKYIFNLKTTRKNPRTVTIDMDHVRTTTIKRFVRSCLALFISDELRLIFDQFLERRLISYGQKFTKMRITPRIIEDLVRREIDIALFWFGREIFDDEAIKRHDRDFRKQMIFKCWELDFFHLNREVIDQKIAFSKYICRLFADGLKNFDFEDFEYQKEVLDEAMNGMHLNSSTKNLHKPAVLARMFTLDLLRKLAKSRLSGKDIVDL